MLDIGAAIITEAYLSFFGFGVKSPTTTCGNIIQEAQSKIETRWGLWSVPGVFIVAKVLDSDGAGD